VAALTPIVLSGTGGLLELAGLGVALREIADRTLRDSRPRYWLAVNSPSAGVSQVCHSGPQRFDFLNYVAEVGADV
jgi:hypothetical protein